MILKNILKKEIVESWITFFIMTCNDKFTFHEKDLKFFLKKNFVNKNVLTLFKHDVHVYVCFQHDIYVCKLHLYKIH